MQLSYGYRATNSWCVYSALVEPGICSLLIRYLLTFHRVDDRARIKRDRRIQKLDTKGLIKLEL